MSQTIPTYSCLENIIALQGLCDPITPTSGLYGTSIGISKDFISQVMTKDYPSELALWNEKKHLAIEEIASSVHAHLQSKYKTVSVSKNFRVGHINENKILVSGSELKGILYELCETDSYLNLFISEISLFTNYTGDIDINVYDLLQGIIIDTITVASVAGEVVTVYPSNKYFADKKHLSLFFAYDATGIDSYKTTPKKGCVNCGGTSCITTSYNTIQAGTIPLASSPIKSSFTGLTETGGLSIIHSLECDHRQWLCGISGALGLPILYKTACKIIEHALYESVNSRVNTNVTLNREILQERLTAYEFKARETLDSVLAHVRLPQDDKCFICESTANYRSMAM